MNSNRQLTESERKRMIAERAYFNWLERDPEGGDPVGDWLKAEKAIDAKFKVSPHDRNLEKLYEQLAEANEKLREMAAKFAAEAKEEWEEEVGRIYKVRDEFSEKLEEIRAHTGEAKQGAKRQADKLWEDLVEGLKRIGAYPK